MYGRAEEMYRKYKRPEGHDFMKAAKSVGVPVSLDSGNYRYAFSESKINSAAPAKKQKTLSGQSVESFEFKLARSVRRLSKFFSCFKAFSCLFDRFLVIRFPVCGQDS